MTETQKKVDSGFDYMSSNCESEEKGSNQTHVNGLQEQGTASFVMDMESFEKDFNHFIINSRTTLQRSFSRKGSLRSSEKKMNQNISNDTREVSIATSPPGRNMREMSVPETLGTSGHAINFPVHNQIIGANGSVGATAMENKYHGKRFSFRPTSSFSWTVDPRKILIFFATLSSVGTILLIYLTLTVKKNNIVEESGLN